MAEDELSSEQELRQKAEKRVSERTTMWWSLGSWLAVNLMMVAIWLLTGRGYPWFLWVLLATSIGLFFSLWGYFGGKRSESRREQMIEKEMEKIKQGK